jgi:hypothetical protein
MKLSLIGLLQEESKSKYEYQIRDINGLTFYKRKSGEKIWSFTTTDDFVNNAHKSKIIKWNNK